MNPAMSQGRPRTLIIEPHSDDGVISAGGLLERLRSTHQMFFALVVASDLYMHHGGTVTRDERLGEYDAYVQHFGGTWLRAAGDTSLPLDMDSRLDQFPRRDLVRIVETLIEMAEPDVLLVCGPSFHHDHTAVFEATVAALRPTARYMPREVLVLENPTYVHSSGPTAQFIPDTYVVLTDDEIDAKLRVFEECFPTQVRPDSNYLSSSGIRSWARYRGIEARAEYAEAFRTFFRML